MAVPERLHLQQEDDKGTRIPLRPQGQGLQERGPIRHRRALSKVARLQDGPAAPWGAEDIAAAARREFDQLERDAIADPSRLKDYINKFVCLKDPGLWRQFSPLAGSEGPNVLDAEFVNRSYREKVRTAVARGERTPSFHDHVVKEMEKSIREAIESKQGKLAPLGTASLSCSKCGSTAEAYPNSEADSTYRICCNSCNDRETWNCRICNEEMRCVRNGKQALYLQCPKCGYGYRFATPIKLNSPQTDEGWLLLRHIERAPPFFDSRPRRTLEVVTGYEKYHDSFRKNPSALAMLLRSIAIPAEKADKIAGLLLHTTISTAWRPISLREIPYPV